MKMICFGDSNTYGFDPRSYFGGRYSAESRWVDILEKKTGWDITNMGQNGLSIPDGDYESALYDKIICEPDTDILIVMLGSNDLLQGMSAKAVSARMGRFLSSLSITRDKILLIAPPTFKSGLWVDDENTLEQSSQLGPFYMGLSKKLGVAFADAGKWGISLCYDGVHFTEAGHKVFADRLFNLITKEKEI